MKVQCQICKDVFDDGTDPEGVLVPDIGLPQVTCSKCAARLRQDLVSLSCPLCDCNEVATTWIDHEFQYGDERLKCKVPVRSCLVCSGQWLDHVGEDIIEDVI